MTKSSLLKEKTRNKTKHCFGSLCPHARFWLEILNNLSQGGLGLLRRSDSHLQSMITYGCRLYLLLNPRWWAQLCDGHSFGSLCFAVYFVAVKPSRGALCPGLFGVNASVLIFPMLLATKMCLKGKICLVQNRKFQSASSIRTISTTMFPK